MLLRRATGRTSALSPATLLAAALVATSLAGCSALTPPKPPAYTGTDTAGDVSADAFVGRWRMVALNPADGEEVPERTITYAADGTFTGEIVPTADMAASIGDEPIRTGGSWAVTNGRLSHDDTSIEMPGDDLISRMASRLMASTPAIAAEAEIYEVGADRIVVVSEQGYANALERLR